MGNRLPAAAQVTRNQQIVVDRARGLRWATVAKRNRISTRWAQEIWREHQADALANQPNPQEELYDEVAYIDAAIEELAEIAADTKNDAVRLGAIKARLDAQTRRLELKRLCGLLPWDLGQAGFEHKLEVFMRSWLAAAEKAGVEWPPGTLDRMWDDVIEGNPRANKARAAAERLSRENGLTIQRQLQRKRQAEQMNGGGQRPG